MKAIFPARALAALRRRAELLAADPEAARRLIDEAFLKARSDQGGLTKIREELSTFLRLLRAALSGQYRTLPWATIIKALAAVIYFVNPLDIIPDFIIGAGLLDDLTVLAFVFNAMRGDLSAFRAWEAAHDRIEDNAPPVSQTP